MGKLYSQLKFLRFPEQLEALSRQQVTAPVHIRIKPNNNCNHDCWYCAYHSSDLMLGEDMNGRDVIPETKMFEIVDDIVAMGVKAVTFSGGGEPLIYKPLPETIERLAKGGVKVAAITNGSNLKGRVADVFAKHGTWVRISVDAWDDASYSQSRKIPHGAFSKLLENMHAFSARESACVLGISFIVDNENYRHLYDACAQFKAAGASHVKVSGVVVGNDAETNNSYHESIRDEVARQLTLSRDLEDASFTIIDHYHGLPALFAKDYHTCPSLQLLTVIGADGNVYACHDKAYTDSGLLGSIESRSFREFWFSEENRDRLYGLDPAVECPHHCVAHGKNLALLEYLDIDPEHGAFV